MLKKIDLSQADESDLPLVDIFLESGIINSLLTENDRDFSKTIKYAKGKYLVNWP